MEAHEQWSHYSGCCAIWRQYRKGPLLQRQRSSCLTCEVVVQFDHLLLTSLISARDLSPISCQHTQFRTEVLLKLPEIAYLLTISNVKGPEPLATCLVATADTILQSFHRDTCEGHMCQPMLHEYNMTMWHLHLNKGRPEKNERSLSAYTCQGGASSSSSSSS